MNKHEARFAGIFKSAPDVIVVYNQDRDITFVSDSVKTVLGYDPEEYRTSHKAGELAHPDDAELLKSTFQSILAEPEKPHKITVRARHKDGSWRWVESTTLNLLENPQVRALVVFFRDITQRKLAESALKESQEKYRAVSELVSDYAYAFIIHKSGEFELEWVTEAFTRITGFTPQESEQRGGWATLIHPEDMAIAQGRAAALLEGKTDISEFRIITKNGETRWLQDHGIPEYSEEEGRVVKILGAARDITHQKKAELELQSHHKFLDSILENSQVGIFVVNVIGGETYEYAYINSMQERITGVKAEQVLGKSPEVLRRYYDDEAVQIVYDLYNRCVREKRTIELEHPVMIAGEETWWYSKVSPIIDEQGRVVQIIGNAILITERIAAEQELRTSEEKFRFLAENMNDIVWTVDLSLHTTYVSPSIENVLGFTVEERLRQSIVEMLTPASVEKVSEILALELQREDQGDAYPDRGVSIDVEYIHKNGSTKWMTNYIKGIRDQNARLTGFYGVSRDISEQKRSEIIMQARLRLMELANQQNLNEILTATLDEAEALTQSQIGFYHFVGEDEESVSPAIWSSNTLQMGCIARPDNTHHNISNAGVWVDCVHRREAVIHNNYADLPHRKGLPEGHIHLTRELVLPIIRQGKIVAILGVGNKPRDYTENDVESVSRLADLAWDIVLHKKAQDSLIESEERFRRLSEASFEGILIHRDDVIIDANQAFCEMFGCEIEALVGKSARAFSTKELRKAALQQIRGHSEALYEGPAKRQDGSTIYVEVRSKDLPLGDQTVSITAVRDISERKLTEAALQQSQANLSRAQQIAHLGNWDWEVPKDRLVWSDEIYTIFGVGKDFELQYDAIARMIHPDDRHKIMEFIDTLHTAEPVPELDFRILRPDGDIRHIHQTAEVFRDETGHPKRVFGIMQDITERQQLLEQVIRDANELERRVQERTEQYQTIINLTADREIRMAELKQVIKKLRKQLQDAGIEPMANDPLASADEESPPGRT